MELCTTTIDKHGRVVIPAEHRRALGLQAGDVVVLTLVDKELQLIGQHEAFRRVQEMVRKHVGDNRSLVDELIAERHAEAARE